MGFRLTRCYGFVLILCAYHTPATPPLFPERINACAARSQPRNRVLSKIACSLLCQTMSYLSPFRYTRKSATRTPSVEFQDKQLVGGYGSNKVSLGVDSPAAASVSAASIVSAAVARHNSLPCFSSMRMYMYRSRLLSTIYPAHKWCATSTGRRGLPLLAWMPLCSDAWRCLRQCTTVGCVDTRPSHWPVVRDPTLLH
jgi:hypothetical protein